MVEINGWAIASYIVQCFITGIFTTLAMLVMCRLGVFPVLAITVAEKDLKELDD